MVAPNPRDSGDRDPEAPHRRALRQGFPSGLHHQRWHAGSAFSRRKRRLGSALTARGAAAQRIEPVPRVPTHNLALLAVAA